MADESPLGLDFTVEVDAPADLAFQEVRADALITVTARPGADAGPGMPTAEVLIMDRSLSMAALGKLDAAKSAVCAAIDALRDGSHLGIIAGNHRSDVIFPAAGGLARVDAATRAAAKRQVVRQLAEGGTAIGAWLTEADRMFAAAATGDAVRHAVLYTDGKDEHETPEELGDALTACADRFVCDARGLGDDWNYAELLRIAEALHGTAEAVVAIADLAGDFTRLIRQAQRIVVPRVYLGLRLNDRFRLGFVRQTRPVAAELTGQLQRSEREIHIPLGSWPPEVRQYQVSLRFDSDALPVDEDLRAARITLRAQRPDGSRPPCAEPRALVVRRRATPGFRTLQTAGLTLVESERELGMAMRACADAHDNGELDRADRELRTALELAESLGDTVRLRLLRALSATGPDGLPRLRRDVSRGEMQQLGLESARTGAPPADPITAPPAPGTTLRRRCPRCGTTTAGRLVRHCEQCGHPFDGPATDDEGPADRGPTGRGPADRGPVGQGPANQSPANQGPADQDSADQGPADAS